MTFDPFFAVPGTQRMPAEVETECYLLRRRVVAEADDARLLGRLDVLRWVLGETNAPPLTDRQERTKAGLQRELDVARSVQLGVRPGDPQRGLGVREQIAWLLDRSV